VGHCVVQAGEDLNISPAFKAFFQKHFNTVTDEVYQKWDAQEPNEGIYILRRSIYYEVYTHPHILELSIPYSVVHMQVPVTTYTSSMQLKIRECIHVYINEGIYIVYISFSSKTLHMLFVLHLCIHF
jgi:hypothetical protein